MTLDEFRQDVLDYAGQFTLPLAAAKAIGNIKRSVQSGIEIPLEYHLALGVSCNLMFHQEDARSIASYVERRTLASQESEVKKRHLKYDCPYGTS